MATSTSNLTTDRETVPAIPVPRGLVFGYSLLCYAIGMAGLFSLVLHSLGLIELQGLLELEGTDAWLVQGGLIAFFGVQHAIMAREPWKRAFARLLPVAMERSTFVVISGLLTGSMVLLWQPMDQVIWSAGEGALHWTIFGLGAAGWLYMVAASFAIDHFELFGLRQAWQHLRGQKVTAPRFVRRFHYAIDRHPIMTGLLVGLWAQPTMTMGHLTLASGLTFYVLLGVSIEERSLLRAHRDTYSAYKGEVRSIVPTLPHRNRVSS